MSIAAPAAQMGPNKKVHLVTDLRGWTCVVFLTASTVRDCAVAKPCLDAVPPADEVIADKGYDSADLRTWLAERGTKAAIPSHINRKRPFPLDAKLYRPRNVIGT